MTIFFLYLWRASFFQSFVCDSFPREEDEYSELRSELSHSQHEANEDSRSMDQDQTSVSVPENQSTMVTADMGEPYFEIEIMYKRSSSLMKNQIGNHK